VVVALSKGEYMRKLNMLCICAALSAGLLAQEPVAPPEGGRHQRPNQFLIQRETPPYDKSKEEVIKAKVVEAKELTRPGSDTLVALDLDVDGKSARIALGTKEYVKKSGIVFSAGDEITIKGIIFARRERNPGEGAGQAGAGAKEGAPADGKPAKEGEKDQKGPKDGKGPDAKGVKPPMGAGFDRKYPIRAGEGQRPPMRDMRIRAREVTKGKKTLTVLTADGSWAGIPKRSPDDAKAQKPAAEKTK
jgi:hypothetical protein